MADNVASVLNDLIETCKDGEQGFSTSADDAKDPELKTTFRRHAQECARSAAELQTLVSRLGGKPEERGSVAGAVHRGWVNLKSSVTPRTDLAILEECERGEDVAKARYSKALENALPEDIRQVVERQYAGVMRNHNEIRDLRDQYRARRA